MRRLIILNWGCATENVTRAGRAFLTVVIKTVMKVIRIPELLVFCHLILKKDQTIIEVLELLRFARVEKIKKSVVVSTDVKMAMPRTNMEIGADKVVGEVTEPTAMLVIKIGGVGIGEKAIPEGLESYRPFVPTGKKKKSPSATPNVKAGTREKVPFV